MTLEFKQATMDMEEYKKYEDEFVDIEGTKGGKNRTKTEVREIKSQHPGHTADLKAIDSMTNNIEKNKEKK
ncbi:hypothetical protein Ciccas_001324 [Cichlidogyrus casuarinus]|uniref:Uncharacterized protein n=1 Tax=Cichlidogyrus casuarinus TaxID=1844966 RepID=A0ABD2QKG5_9PLAT